MKEPVTVISPQSISSPSQLISQRPPDLARAPALPQEPQLVVAAGVPVVSAGGHVFPASQ